MANKKITDLVEITSAANVDVLPIVDVSADITNKIKVENLPISTATQTALDAKQDTLVSGTNIKTINSTSLLGSGDIAIAANPAGTAGQIQFSDGSAFAADSNLFWDNTNKRLGVGTSSPQSDFDVLTSNGAGFLRVAANGGGSVRMTGDFSFAVNARGSISFENNTTEIARVASTGLGVGTLSNPTARLQVKGSGSTSATTSLLVQNSSGTEFLKVDDSGVFSVNGFIFNSNNIQPKVNGFIAIDRDTNKLFGVRDLGGTRNFLLVQSSSGSNFADITMNTDHLVVKKEGTVGIGTTTPTARTHIKGSGSTSATTSLLVQNSSGTELLKVTDDGNVQMSGQALSGVSVLNNSSSLRFDSGGVTGVMRMQGNAVGIGNNTTGDASALLTLTATTKGFLPPRMTTTQKNSISTPAEGLMVMDITTHKLCVYDGTSWVDLH